MTTPQQFIESFLQEKAAAYSEAALRLAPIYASYFGEPLSKHAASFMPREKAVVEEVKESADSTRVITNQHFGSAVVRERYHLAAVGDTWKIVRIDRECFLCRGTGRRSAGAPCARCNGDGWYEPTRDAS